MLPAFLTRIYPQIELIGIERNSEKRYPQMTQITQMKTANPEPTTLVGGTVGQAIFVGLKSSCRTLLAGG